MFTEEPMKRFVRLSEDAWVDVLSVTAVLRNPHDMEKSDIRIGESGKLTVTGTPDEIINLLCKKED